MSTPRLRPPRRRFTRPAALAACGLLIAVLAEASSVGLLALSGWFIAACAAAGASVSSTFSYLAPSGTAGDLGFRAPTRNSSVLAT